jgi:hypothetical protein
MSKFSSTDSGATVLSKLNNTIVTVGTQTGCDYICDGTSDDVQINTAISYVSSLGGGIVQIMDGTYNISANVTLASSISLLGVGYATNLVLSRGYGLRIPADSSYVAIRGIRIDADANDISPNDYAIQVKDSDFVEITDNYILNCGGYGIYAYSSGTTAHRNLRILRNVMSGKGNADVIGGGTSVAAGEYSEVIIKDNFLKQNTSLADSGTYGTCIAMTNMYKCLISGNITYGTIGASSEEIPHTHVTFTNNILQPAVGLDYCQLTVKCSSILEETDESSFITFIGNQIKEGQMLIQGQASSSSYTQEVIITGNNVAISASAVAVALRKGLILQYVKNATVIGNVFEGGHTAVEHAYCDYVLIEGNVIKDCTYKIINSGDTSTNISIGKNIGYVNENSGTGTIANGATTATITHGLSVTPTLKDITITLGENPTNTPGAIWVNTL